MNLFIWNEEWSRTNRTKRKQKMEWGVRLHARLKRLDMSITPFDDIGVGDQRLQVRFKLHEFIRVPHSRGHTLEVDVYSGNRIAVKEVLFVDLEERKRDAEKSVHAFEEEYVPHAEQSLYSKAVREEG